MIHYFAYGSNLHPIRLSERVPSAKLVGVVELIHHRLTFHKKSIDGSSKCNLFNTGSASDSVHGAIYELATEHKELLDNFEGEGSGYIDNQFVVRHQVKEYNCFTYLAQQSHIVDNLRPYHWYKELVVLGAKYLGFPNAYIASIESIISVEDTDDQRRKGMEVLLQKVRNFR